MTKSETFWLVVYVVIATALAVLINIAYGWFAAFFTWGLIISLFIVGTISGREASRKRQWCVFDGADPENQVILEARTAEQALAMAAQQVFGLMVEEVR